MTAFIKMYSAFKTNCTVVENEIELQEIGAKLGLSPRILKHYENDFIYYIEMEKINGMTLADYYGEKMSDLPPSILAEVKRILKTLLHNGIQFIDVTPYNFMIETETERIYIIDYEHATRIHINWYIKEFILEDSYNEWNPDFK